MKLLLTSGGVTNPSIRAELVRLLGKPIEEATALCIPSAQYGQPACTPESAWRFVAGSPAMTGLGWRSVGLLELLALPEMDPDRWVPWVEHADVLLVDGGEATFLAHWIRRSGLVDVLPRLEETVWVGVSAGSMAMAPRIGPEFVNWPKAPDDRALGIVEFAIFPHLDHKWFPENTLAEAEKWARQFDGPAYAIDDQSAISVDGADLRLVTEGKATRLR